MRHSKVLVALQFAEDACDEANEAWKKVLNGETEYKEAQHLHEIYTDRINRADCVYIDWKNSLDELRRILVVQTDLSTREKWTMETIADSPNVRFDSFVYDEKLTSGQIKAKIIHEEYWDSQKSKSVWCYAIAVDGDFWLQICKSEQEAIDFCREMGWEVEK